MEPDKPTGILGATANLTATLSGKFGRLEVSDIVLGALCLLLILAGLIAETNGSQFAGFLVGGGLLGAIVVVCNRLLQNWLAPAGPNRAQALITQDRTYVSTMVGNTRDLVLILRQLMQGRHKLPPPQGEVMGNNPADTNNLREYSPEERDAAIATIEANITEHDDQLLAEAHQLVQSQEVGETAAPIAALTGHLPAQPDGGGRRNANRS